ncbi:MAG: hypothetical protein E7507_04410 [Ruminococcus sp.]|nr:hypothetical protein [Ruminococcus sp.]
MKNRYSEQEKFEYVKNFLESGLSIKEFARRNDIGNKSLARWIDKYSSSTMSDKPSSASINSTTNGEVIVKIPYKEFLELVRCKILYESLNN